MTEDINQISEINSEPANLDQLHQELIDALQKAEENLSGWKRTQADFENFRKRQEGESTALINFAKHAVFTQIVPVLDSLQQAMIQAPTDVQDEKYLKWKSGLEGIIKQIETILAQNGIQKIQALGQKFDPNFHEAVREVPGEEDGLVSDEYQTGYTLDGKLIRPAQVAITKKG